MTTIVSLILAASFAAAGSGAAARWLTDPRRGALRVERGMWGLAGAAVAAAVLLLAPAREADAHGVPAFVVGGELFWGDDRLEDAISWARDGKVG